MPRMTSRNYLSDFMPAQITIRNVPDDVHKELKERAALRGQSLQEYMRRELERIASKPAADIMLERLRQRKKAEGTNISVESILRAKDADRT